jgi:hypothetical protein
MVKVAGNRSAAVLVARFLLVCTLLAIGFTSNARANEYQYTITFDPMNLSGLSMSVKFDATSLPGSTGLNIDPSDVQIFNSPYAAPYVESVSVQNNSLSLAIDMQTCPGGCDGIAGYLTRRDVGIVDLLNPITGPGTYQFGSNDLNTYGTLEEWVVGGGSPIGIFNPEGSVAVMVTPEPNSGLMIGACFLLCAAVALRRKIRRPVANYP